MRLNKFIAESGLCSRREADRYIEKGNVFINGKRASVGDQVKPRDIVRVNGNELEPLQEEDIIFIALNKPVGITSMPDFFNKGAANTCLPISKSGFLPLIILKNKMASAAL